MGVISTLVFLPGESPWTEEPGGLQTMGSQRVRHHSAIRQSTQHVSALRALWRYLISWLSFSLPNHMGVYSGTRVPGFKPDFTTSQLCDLNSYLTTLKMCPHL